MSLMWTSSYVDRMNPKLEAVPLVEIDDEGVFKYVLIKVYGPEQDDGSEPSKVIVRGSLKEWHGEFVWTTYLTNFVYASQDSQGIKT